MGKTTSLKVGQFLKRAYNSKFNKELFLILDVISVEPPVYQVQNIDSGEQKRIKTSQGYTRATREDIVECYNSLREKQRTLQNHHEAMAKAHAMQKDIHREKADHFAQQLGRFIKSN